MFKSQEIADLQGKVTKLEADLAKEQGEKATLQTNLDQAKADLATAQAESAKVSGLKTQITTLEGQVTTEKARADKAEADLTAAKADFETKVEAEVNTRLAAAGVQPIARDPKAKTETGSPTAGLTGRQRLAAAFNAQVAPNKK